MQAMFRKHCGFMFVSRLYLRSWPLRCLVGPNRIIGLVDFCSLIMTFFVVIDELELM